MNDTKGEGHHVPARFIPIPTTISAQARAMLMAGRPPQPPLPALTDKAAWRLHIEKTNTMWAGLMAPVAEATGVATETRTIAGVPVYVCTPPQVPEKNRGKILLYIHGGGLVIMGGECTNSFGMMEAAALRCVVYAVDYRNPPDHPYPAALDDCVAVYRDLIKTTSPLDIVVSGASGGGNLAAAMTLKIRDTGLPMPAAVGLWTPEVDLTESGDTFQTLAHADVVLAVTDLFTMNLLYADGHDLKDPYISPVFGDFGKGFPPTFIQTGTRDKFLSNSALIHRALRRADIPAELHVGEAMPHGGFAGAPEDREMKEEFIKFLAKTAGWAPL
jgi:acetyl esterase/lipase